MRLFARMGIPAPREVVRPPLRQQPVDRALRRRRVGGQGSAGARLRIIDDNVQNDGYLFEYNYILGSPWRFDYLGADLDAYEPRFDPKTHENKSASEKWGPIEELVRMVNETASASLPRRAGAAPRRSRRSSATSRCRTSSRRERRVHRLRRDEQLLLLSPRGQHAARADRLGRGQRVRAPGLRHHHPARRERADAQGDGMAGLAARRYFAALQEAANSARQPDEGQSEGWLHVEVRRQLDLIADAMREDPSKPVHERRVRGRAGRAC